MCMGKGMGMDVLSACDYFCSCFVLTGLCEDWHLSECYAAEYGRLSRQGTYTPPSQERMSALNP